MTGADWTVLALGAAAIAWVNWYFFLEASARSRDGETTGEPRDESREHHHG